MAQGAGFLEAYTLEAYRLKEDIPEEAEHSPVEVEHFHRDCY